MLVDDDEDVRVTIAQMLQGDGHEIVPAASGKEALDVLDKGEPLDLLVTDVMMPGLNGFNLARMARTRRPSIRVLYLTGYHQQAVTLRDEGSKYGKLLIKPISPADLRKEVTAALSS
jgi:CheY-like chemotaxis protein